MNSSVIARVEEILPGCRFTEHWPGQHVSVAEVVPTNIMAAVAWSEQVGKTAEEIANELEVRLVAGLIEQIRGKK